ncbi:MAG: sigma-54 interaction domain-containing protein [Pseudobdellovibrionaceae bacterium]
MGATIGLIASYCFSSFDSSIVHEFPSQLLTTGWRAMNMDFQMQDMIGTSKIMQSLAELVRLASISDANVLITGETGSGKELVARGLHLGSSRHNQPFIPINCAAIPENLLESELFGHAKGAFTGASKARKGLFEEAEGGTLFLDEIGDLPLNLQTKILRVLQDRQVRAVGSTCLHKVNVRVVAATHCDLSSMIQTKAFREDLFYRLNVIPIRVPSLRERREDIPLLAEKIIGKISKKNGTTPKPLSDEALKELCSYCWPGNVRELENLIERALVMNVGSQLESRDFHEIAQYSKITSKGSPETESLSLADLEKNHIKSILQKTQNRKDQAAKILGISIRTLSRKERILGLENHEAKST